MQLALILLRRVLFQIWASHAPSSSVDASASAVKSLTALVVPGGRMFVEERLTPCFARLLALMTKGYFALGLETTTSRLKRLLGSSIPCL